MKRAFSKFDPKEMTILHHTYELISQVCRRAINPKFTSFKMATSKVQVQKLTAQKLRARDCNMNLTGNQAHVRNVCFGKKQNSSFPLKIEFEARTFNESDQCETEFFHGFKLSVVTWLTHCF